MILTIKEGSWQIDTSIDENTGLPWADLYLGEGQVAGFKGDGCVEMCLDHFRGIMDLDEDEINDWQQERGE